ncbi:Phosphoribosylaminoimidazole-succinocarboxamide synthase [hydrothermal vent metagenome]|uniref:phosphoribosylaminoimidazolesuccinocarboxamide synthase n=1 Tax=hydrothermal vent metagenome TaxID=652676 RepID=A0A3B1E7Q7_9ZZZZ
MDKQELLYEGKAKKIFKTSDENKLILEFKDDLTAFNGDKKAQEQNKGALNNQITTQIFTMLENKAIKTHFIKQLDDTHMLAQKADVIMIEVIVRNITTGSIVKRLGLKDKTKLDKPLVEFCYKNDDFDDPIINDEHALIMNLVDEQSTLDYLKKTARQINTILQEYFLKANLILVDFKIEFGINNNGEIILVDEITPDSCRLWDKDTNEKLDKDIFRQSLGSVTKAYKEVLSRLN